MTVSNQKISFIVNPHSAMGSTGREWGQISAIAKDRLGLFQSYLTTGPGDATRLTRRALFEGAKVVVCVGGDGTLNEVVNGFMAEEGPLHSDAKLGFIPRGTGLDLIKSLPIPKDPRKIFDLITHSRTRRMDLGRIRFMNPNGQSFYRYFHNITSFGLGGEVVERVNRSTKAFGGFFSFIWATLVSIFIYNKKEIHLKVDDHFDKAVTVWNVAVANGQYHGGGMWIAPEASLDDGHFHVTVVGDLSLIGVFRNLPNLYNGKVLQVKKVFSLVGKRVEAYSKDKVLLDVDGEESGRLPVTIEMVPDALSIFAEA